MDSRGGFIDKKKRCWSTLLSLDFSIPGKIHRILGLFFCFLITFSVRNISAQVFFYSHKVDSLYKSVNQVYLLDSICFKDTILQCSDIIDGDTVPIILCKDETGVVDHIGCCFLPDSIRLVNIPVVQFLEREILTILTNSDVITALRSDLENGLQLMYNDHLISHSLLQDKKGLCSLLKQCNGIIIKKEDNTYYVSLVSLNGNQLSFSFPADCNLISGMNKKELEIRLSFQLKNHISKNIDDQAALSDLCYLQLMKDTIFKEQVYVKKGDEFNIPQINNDLFYFKEDSIYSLISDTSFVALSFSNVLLAPSSNHYTIDIKHRMYSSIVQNYAIDIQDFNDFFSQGFERFFGIESLMPGNLSGTMILYNRNEEYIHLAYVTTTLEDLINGGKIVMDLYSYIPQHNIKTLYGEQLKGKE